MEPAKQTNSPMTLQLYDQHLYIGIVSELELACSFAWLIYMHPMHKCFKSFGKVE